MRLYLKGHYITIHTTRMDYVIQCSCGMSQVESISYDELLRFCLHHASYSVSDYLRDKKWCENQEPFKEQTRDIIQNSSLSLAEMEQEVAKVALDRQKYETMELVFPLIERELSKNVLY